MAKIKKETNDFLEALKFVSVAQKPIGSPNETHVRLVNNTAVAFNGVIGAGCYIKEDLQACPHTLNLVNALNKCGSSMSISLQNNGRIAISSGKFRAFVPCVKFEELNPCMPDVVAGKMDNRIKAGFEMLSPLISESSEHVVTASLMLTAGSMYATNRHMIFEFWHGLDLPPELLIPKAFINAVLRTQKNITQFGFSQSSLTIYFEDNSWLKTQLYKEKYPDMNTILSVSGINAWPLPEGFFEAVSTLSSFMKDTSPTIYFLDGKLKTEVEDNDGASFVVPGVPVDVAYNGKYLAMLDGLVKTVDFKGPKDAAYFYGDNFRGALSAIRFKK